MDAAVCIPWRDSGEPARQAAVDWVTRWWASRRFTYALHGGPAGPFNISAARNEAARIAIDAGAKILVFADADVVPEPMLVARAIYEARICPGVIYPHDHYWSLTERSTGHLLHSNPDDADPRMFLTDGEALRTSVSGVVVCTADSWRAIGGWDEAFTGWGLEDVAFALMARDVLGRALRLEGNIWHLWHPRDGYPTVTSPEHVARMEAYRAAALEGPHALRALRGLPG